MAVDPTLAHNVVLLSEQGMSRRAVSRALKISRNTVREILEGHVHTRQAPHRVLGNKSVRRRASKLDPYRTKVDALLDQYNDITAQRVFEVLCGDGFDGSYTVVKQLVRRLRPATKPKPSYQTDPREPADMAECDWSPYSLTFTNAEPMEVQTFGYTLRYSTRKTYSFHQSNGLHPLMAGHVQAFERFGGVAHRCKYDSQKPVVLRWEGGQPIYNLRFIDFATYYEFAVEACRRYKPNDKPRVERGFWELERSFFCGRSFRDFADLKGQLAHWLDTIADQRPLKRDRHNTRLGLFAQEQPLLRPLPAHPYDTARVMYKLCDIEGFIAWDANWYSLPYEYVTEILPVRITEDELFIYKPDLTCIARHPLLARGAQLKSILEGHRPRRADCGPDLDQLRAAFAALGETGAEFLAAVEKHQCRSVGYHARKVLALREGYDTEQLLSALSHALQYGAVKHTDVEQILLSRGRPRRLDEYVAEHTAKKLRQVVDASSTEPRDLAEYDALPCHSGSGDQPGEPSCLDNDTPPLTSAVSKSSST